MKPQHAEHSKWAAVVLVGCLLILGLLHNPYWSRGGDSDVYLAIARNVAQGEGLVFNNNPVAVVPPLWPWVLAGVMKLTTSFALLKLVPLLSMTGAIQCWYWIGLRYLAPKQAAGLVLLIAFLSQVFTLALWFHTEAFYCLISSLAVLLATQINEGRSFWWRAGVIVALLVASVLTRWAGVMWCVIVAAALLRGEWPWFNRQTVLAAVSVVLVLVAFVMMRKALKVDPSQINPMYDGSLAGAYELAPQVTARDYLNRAIASGNWFGGLFWQAARDFKPLRIATLLTGWIVLLVLCLRTFFDTRRKDWLLLAAMLQAGMLCIGWPDPVARYFVPMAPIFLLGMIRSGIPDAPLRTIPKWGKVAPLALRVFIGSIILCNAVSYSIELYIARQPDYYRHYQAGLNDKLIDIARYITDKNIPEGQIAINRADKNGRRARISNGWLRAFNVLTDRAIRNLPAEMEGDKRDPILYAPDDPRVIAWLGGQGITHYLYRGASNTMWHFRMGSDKNAGNWELYEIRDGSAVKVNLPEVSGWPRNLPGL